MGEPDTVSKSRCKSCRGRAAEVISRRTCRNAVNPIVKNLQERMRTPSPLFKNALWTALQTIFQPKCTRFRICNLEMFLGSYPRNSQKRPRCLDQLTHQFLPRSPAFPFFLVYETTTVQWPHDKTGTS